MFTQSDLAQLEARGISIEKAEKQLQSFATGFPELDIVSAASVGNGVLNPSEEEIDTYIKAWQDYLDEGHTVLKFVPASGAASRMFKNLFEYLDDGKKTDFIEKFLSEKDRFAFGPQLAHLELWQFTKGIASLPLLRRWSPHASTRAFGGRCNVRSIKR